MNKVRMIPCLKKRAYEFNRQKSLKQNAGSFYYEEKMAGLYAVGVGNVFLRGASELKGCVACHKP